MRRLRAGDERTPQPPGGDGAPPGGNRTSRQELADRGPTRANAELVAESAARCIVRRRDGAPKGAASSQKEDAQSNDLTRFLGAPSPLLFEREGKTGLPRAATKNRGDESCLARSGQARRALHWLSSFRGASASERTRNPDTHAVLAFWIPGSRPKGRAPE
jgi:hypothetical protein